MGVKHLRANLPIALWWSAGLCALAYLLASNLQ